MINIDKNSWHYKFLDRTMDWRQRDVFEYKAKNLCAYMQFLVWNLTRRAAFLIFLAIVVFNPLNAFFVYFTTGTLVAETGWYELSLSAGFATFVVAAFIGCLIGVDELFHRIKCWYFVRRHVTTQPVNNKPKIITEYYRNIKYKYCTPIRFIDSSETVE